MIRKNIASILIVLILINSIGCYSNSQINIEDAEEIEKDDEVKIATSAGDIYILTDVTIEGSEVKGLVVPTHSEKIGDIRGKEVVIPTEQIKRIEINNFNPALTAFTVVLIIGIPAAFAIAMANTEIFKGIE